jgi:hypothetical protein
VVTVRVQYACTVRIHCMDAGVDRLIVILQRVFVDIYGIVGLKRPKNRLYAFHARLVPRLTYGLHRAKVASRVPVSPTILDMTSTMEGP